jgi:hypothetical protein
MKCALVRGFHSFKFQSISLAISFFLVGVDQKPSDLEERDEPASPNIYSYIRGPYFFCEPRGP